MKQQLPTTSMTVGDSLRRAERSLARAKRDLLNFMIATEEACVGHRFNPSVAQPVTSSATAALVALEAGMKHLAIDTHHEAERIAKGLGLTVTDYGGGEPKDQNFWTSGAAASAPATA